MLTEFSTGESLAVLALVLAIVAGAALLTRMQRRRRLLYRDRVERLLGGSR